MICILVACIGIQVTAVAQLKVGGRLGFGIETDRYPGFRDVGFSGQLEVGYGLTDKIEVALLFQHNTLFHDIGDSGIGGNQAYIDTGVLNGRYYFLRKRVSCYGGLGIGIANHRGFVEGLELVRGNFVDEIILRSHNAVKLVVRPSVGCIFHTKSRNRGIHVDVAYIDGGQVGKSFVNVISVSVGVLIGLTSR